MGRWAAGGARLVVVDPRRVGLAVKADHWLPVRPGTDGALALSIAGEMIAHEWFDAAFVREWTNGPFLVRDDNGRLLHADELATGGTQGGFVAWDEGRGAPVQYDPQARRYAVHPLSLALTGTVSVAGREGPISCRPAFARFAELCSAYTPEDTAGMTGVAADAIREAGARTDTSLWCHGDDGANLNLAIGNEHVDPVSGSPATSVQWKRATNSPAPSWPSSGVARGSTRHNAIPLMNHPRGQLASYPRLR